MPPKLKAIRIDSSFSLMGELMGEAVVGVSKNITLAIEGGARSRSLRMTKPGILPSSSREGPPARSRR
ncbi:MAG: hypothetical protein K6U11_08690 [bacterium]|nr:hypothetical protein [bacterium]